MGELSRERLPDAVSYYESEGLTLKGSGPWGTAACVFHTERTPSLRINRKTGAFVCMGCGVHGGDVIAFHMQRHGLEFIPACKALGAWQDDGRQTRLKPLPFSPRAALEVLDRESLIAWTAAHNIAAGLALTDLDRARLTVAASRILHIREAVNAHR